MECLEYGNQLGQYICYVAVGFMVLFVGVLFPRAMAEAKENEGERNER